MIVNGQKIGNKEQGFRLYNLIDNSNRTNFMNLVNYKLKSKSVHRNLTFYLNPLLKNLYKKKSNLSCSF